MKRISFLLLAFLFITGTPTLNAQKQSFTGEATVVDGEELQKTGKIKVLNVDKLEAAGITNPLIISTKGYAERKVTPDIVKISIRIDKLLLDKKRTVIEVQDSMCAILTRMGVDVEEKLRVSDMGANTKVKFLRNKNIMAANYVLELSNAAETYFFMDAMAPYKVTSIEITDMEISNEDEIIMELRGEAARNAKEKAKIYVEALDQTLIKAVRVSETRISPYKFYNYNYNNNYNPSAVSQALAGEIAGVQVVNSLGQPGTSATIRIRGIGTTSASKFEEETISVEVYVDFVFE